MADLRERNKNNYCLKAFMLGLGLSFLVFIPFIIRDGGRFFFYGDFNVQQIPFYRLAHEAVTSGEMGWSHLTDLGANFVGSYSFYLLGSPFFWLTIPFPVEYIEFLMGPLFMLKFACATLTAYIFLQRYLKNKNYAIVGGLLYAFSGYSIYNVFFNHFHEALIIFPLLIAAVDEYMATRRRGIVAIAVFAACVFNYYFFVGQVVFCVIYILLRIFMGSFKVSIRDFLLIVAEAVIGLCMSCILLIPSVLTILQNNRVDNPIFGWNALLYDRNQRYLHIAQSLFFPPDLPARPNFTPDSYSKWSSLGAWLPLFGMTGAIAWLQQRRKHWLKRMIAILFICTLVPVLNSAFQLFNANYYARWFYMLVLMLVLATVMSIESSKVDWKRAVKWNAYICGVMALAIGLMPYEATQNGETTVLIGLEEYPTRFWSYVAISLVCIAIVVYIFKFADKEKMYKNIMVSTSIICVLYSVFFIAVGKIQSIDPYDHMIPYSLNEAKDIKKLEDIDISRSDFYESLDNSGMFWLIPNIQTFHSIVPGSIMEFYDYIGVDRDVASRPEVKHQALRALTSVKWLFDDADDSDYFAGENYDMPKIEGFNYYGNMSGFDIWENDYYVPMGFSYNSYVLKSDADKLSHSEKENLMIESAIIEDDDEEIWSQYLIKNNLETLNYGESYYFQNCEELRNNACEEFRYTKNGFTATATIEEETIIFFSVPYEDGWSATVNGEDAKILKTNIGFMSVEVPKGDNVKITFNFSTPGLYIGIWVSVVSVALLAVYIVYGKRLNKKDKDKEQQRKASKRKLGNFREYCEKMKISLPERK